jgi:D-ribose pyranase
MLIKGILNPAINSLLSRVRHTNTLVIADRGFPFWPRIETVDLSLVDDVPTVLEVLTAIRANFNLGQIYMAKEFMAQNQRAARRVQAARAPGRRAHPHRRHDPLRQHDSRLRIAEAGRPGPRHRPQYSVMSQCS